MPPPADRKGSEVAQAGNSPRLIKRRSVANDACDAGRVMLNDKVAKAGTEVKAGDVITINFGNKDVKAEVLSVQETVRKEEAKEMFKLL